MSYYLRIIDNATSEIGVGDARNLVWNTLWSVEFVWRELDECIGINLSRAANVVEVNYCNVQAREAVSFCKVLPSIKALCWCRNILGTINNEKGFSVYKDIAFILDVWE
ncbi:hypothetical protein D3C80_1949870 [compost metagenome]